MIPPLTAARRAFQIPDHVFADLDVAKTIRNCFSQFAQKGEGYESWTPEGKGLISCQMWHCPKTGKPCMELEAPNLKITFPAAEQVAA